MMDLRGRSLLRETDLTADEFRHLLTLGEQARMEKHAGLRHSRLSGRNIALIFEKASTRTRSAFEVAARDEGAHVTCIGPGDSHLGVTETASDVARVLSRMFDRIEYRGFAQETAETLGRYAGVPVWNGLSGSWHPRQMLADMLTMTDHTGKPLAGVSCCYLGDGRNNTASSLLVTGAMLGMDVRICAPAPLQPSAAVRDIARGLAAGSGARLAVTADVAAAVPGADFLYTDVWLSMGEPAADRDTRIGLLLPYQVNKGRARRDGEPGGEVHALPARAAQPGHRRGPADLRQARAGGAGGHRRGLRILRLHRVRRGGEQDAHDQGPDRGHPG
jgi:ornithine carbamoyltransferase